MSYAIPRDEPDAVTPAVLSALVHLVFLVMLVFGLHWQSRHPDAVEVELWSQLPEVTVPPQAEPTPAPKPEAKPPPEPKVEQKAAKPDIAIEREKKKKKEEAALKVDDTRRIREQLAQEQKALQAREKQDVVKQFTRPTAPAVDAGYVEKIRSRIWGKVDPNFRVSSEAVFQVIQLPTGEVLSAKLLTTSGNPLYDTAVERAIWSSSPLPKPDRPEQFQRELTLKFRPEK